jgi:hypothetical protein
MREKPPFVEDGSQFGVSRTAFRRKRKAEKRELMLQWFHENFQDPNNGTPWVDGEFLWIWGGPYEAPDELYSKFGDIVDEKLIDEVVKEVEAGGITDWAAVHTNDDYEEREPPDTFPSLDIFPDEPGPRYGTPAEQEARARARGALNELKEILDKPPPIGIGHNRPPEQIDPHEIKLLRSAIAQLRVEFGRQNPVISRIKLWTKPLLMALIAIGKWAAAKLDKGVDAAMIAVGSAGGAVVVAWFGLQYSEPLQKAFNAILNWLHIAAGTVP